MSQPVDKIRTDYTEGSVIGSILKMGLPSMFGFLSQNIYSLADTYWVAQLEQGESGVAAITFFATIQWLFFSFNHLIGPGSVAVISRRYGEKEFDQTEKAIKETLILKLFFGFGFGLLGYFLTKQMLWVMGARDLALEQGVVYGQIMFIGMGIMFGTYSIYTALRGIANPNKAMILMLASNALNIILDPFFIFGYCGLPAMGIAGAALASVISFTLTFGVGIGILFSDSVNVRLHLKSKIPLEIITMWKIVRIGLPAWLGQLSFSSARLVITPMIATFGTSVVAAYGVGNQVTHFGISILVGIGLGLGSLIGHNIGSKKMERARHTGDQAIMLGTSVMTVFAVVSLLFPRQIMGLFFNSTDTIEYGVSMLRIFAVGFPFIGAFFMVEEIHVGVGLNIPGMVLNIVHAWFLEVLPIFILTQVLGYSQNAIWWSVTLAMMCASTAFFIYYRRGAWLSAKL
ncbi:MAG TPA: MATE family efflux transporter [candidate division Zixibacteria bacterium]|nr:MATE family efflux transporter [candidate division Zixibacteria bacterium]